MSSTHRIITFGLGDSSPSEFDMCCWSPCKCRSDKTVLSNVVHLTRLWGIEMLGTNAGYHCNRTFLESSKQSKRNVADYTAKTAKFPKRNTPIGLSIFSKNCHSFYLTAYMQTILYVQYSNYSVHQAALIINPPIRIFPATKVKYSTYHYSTQPLPSILRTGL